MKLAPVILFTFNRPEHTKKTLQALVLNKLADQTILYIFSDGGRDKRDEENVKLVREYIKEIKDLNYFLSVHVFESDINKGLAKSVIEGVTQVFLEYDSVIVLEDDLVTSIDFLKFMNEALIFYKESPNIGSVTGYNPLKQFPENYMNDVFIVPRTSSHGWGTWKYIWRTIDWEINDYSSFKTNFWKRRAFNSAGMDRACRLDRQVKKNAHSWSVIFGYNLFRNNMSTIYPIKSKISHIGWDGSGTHNASKISNFNNDLVKDHIGWVLNEVVLNKYILKSFKKLYGSGLKQEIKEVFIIAKNIFVN